MSKTNSETKIIKKPNEDVSVSDFKINDVSSDACKRKLTNLDDKMSSVTIQNDTRENNSSVSSNNLKTSLPVSSSFHGTPNMNQGKSETKKTSPSVPRAKCRKRAQNERIQLMKPEKNAELLNENKSDNFTPAVCPEGEATKNTPSAEAVSKIDKEQNLKSPDMIIPETDQDVSQELPQEIWMNNSFEGNEKQEEETKNPPDTTTDQPETEIQEIVLQYLYDTFKNTEGPLFDKSQWVSKGKLPVGTKTTTESDAKTPQNVQEKYEFILSEISDIWKNTISLIRSVKDHTTEFVDRGNQSVDREQLILEAEMMQLAVDFAINYSKLKSDFFLKWLKEHMHIEKPLEKSELESFLDSKTFAGLYNNEDLNAMAQTVEDLTASVLKGEEFALK